MHPFSECTLCPRGCRVNRLEGEHGSCGCGDRTQVFRSGPHHGEEPPISGDRGSGTVFFSGCTLKCMYCQNHPWSQDGKGKSYDEAGLAEIFETLREQGCHNWNLVSPTPWLPAIAAALDSVKKTGTDTPVVYNTSGFESVDTLRHYGDHIDVYLADLRYAVEATGQAASGTANYVSTARTALQEMWRAVGPLDCDEDGIARRGMICRILILPGHAEEAVASIEWLARTLGTGVALSVMAQYLPAYRARELGSPWDRRITEPEYEQVAEAMADLGMTTGWIQEFEGEAPEELIGYQMQP